MINKKQMRYKHRGKYKPYFFIPRLSPVVGKNIPFWREGQWLEGG